MDSKRGGEFSEREGVKPLRCQLSIGFPLAIVPLAKAASQSSGNESQTGVIEKRMEKYLVSKLLGKYLCPAIIWRESPWQTLLTRGGSREEISHMTSVLISSWGTAFL